MSRNSSCGLIHYGTLLHGEGNGNPLQCSCLENPRDGGAWWAAIYGVAQSGTRLKRLSSSPLTNVTVKQSRSPLCISTRMSHIIWCLTKIQLQENPSGSVVKNLSASAGDSEDVSLTPGSGRCPGEGNNNPLQYSCLENPMDRETWGATVHGVTKSQTWLNMHTPCGN